ncbi:MAG: hypothetical protein EXS16_13700 [Gemmataceae bacterium]|nr:hypothetical protein [Gemmataceae bacterium]
MRIRQTIIAWTLLVGTAILGTVPSQKEAGQDSAAPDTALNFSTGEFDVESDDPFARMEQQLIDAKNLREAHEEWRRYWLKDQPAHLTPYRIHGGVAPASSSI